VKKLVLYLSALFIFALNADADHIVGSEISYIYNSANKYTILTKVYRNCNDCKLNGNGGGTNPSNCNDVGTLDIYGFNKTQKKYIKLSSVATTRLGIKDQTILCPGETSTCNSTSTYGYGVEEHLFESEIDLSTHLTNDYNQFKFAITIDARSPGISSSSLVQNHFNFCYLNTGVVQKSSPFSTGIPFNRINTNDAIYSSVRFTANGFDSISYALDTAYISETIKNSYPVSHSPNTPVGVLAGNDPFIHKPTGMHLNAKSGQLIFTPNVASDIGVFVIECRGFIRDGNGKMQLTSVVRKDFECIVSNGNNNSPYFYGITQADWQACEGEVFSDDIYYKDNPIGGVFDTVYINQSNSNPYSLNLQHTVQTYAPYRTTNFTWQVPNGSARPEPYSFTIIANDSNCPKPGISYYNYRIKVSKAKIVTADKVQTNCNQFLYTALGDAETDVLRFSILDKDRNELPGSAVFNDSALLTFPSKGKWYIRLISVEESAPCSYVFIDSLDIADFKKPEVVHQNDYRVCPKEAISINPTITIYNGPPQYTWITNGVNINNNTPFLDTFFATDQQVITRVLDGTGCSVEDTLNIKIKPKWNNELLDTGICINFSEPLYLRSSIKDTGALINATFTGTNVMGNYFDATGLGLGKYTIRVNVTDSVFCPYIDSFSIEIGNPFVIEHLPLGMYCQRTQNIDLNEKAKPKPAGGSWKYPTAPAWIKGSIFQLDQADSGNFKLNYSVTENGCTVDTLLPITVQYAPKITLKSALPDSICENSAPFEIDIVEHPALYDINGRKDSILNASLIQDSAVIFIARSHGLNACTHTFRKVIVIDTLIKTNLVTNKNPICFEQDTIELSLSNNQYTSTWIQNGTGTFSNLGSGNYQYILTSTEKSNLDAIDFEVSLASENTCPNKILNLRVNQNAEFNMYYDSFVLNHCEPGLLRLQVRDHHFLYYDSVHWYRGGNKVEGNGFANNKHQFSALATGVSSFNVIPFKNGCKAKYDTFAEIFPKPNPLLSASPDKFYSARFPNIKFNINNFNPAYQYTWSTTPKFVSLSGGNPFNFQMPSDTGKHSFTLFTTSDKGCKDTLVYDVTALPKDWILVPNAFTPNNDGPLANELFKPLGRVSSNYRFQIFNFWGEKLFETTNIKQGWNGVYVVKNVNQDPTFILFSLSMILEDLICQEVLFCFFASMIFWCKRMLF